MSGAFITGPNKLGRTGRTPPYPFVHWTIIGVDHSSRLIASVTRRANSSGSCHVRSRHSDCQLIASSSICGATSFTYLMFQTRSASRGSGNEMRVARYPFQAGRGRPVGQPDKTSQSSSTIRRQRSCCRRKSRVMRRKFASSRRGGRCRSQDIPMSARPLRSRKRWPSVTRPCLGSLSSRKKAGLAPVTLLSLKTQSVANRRSTLRRATVREMKEGPSGSVIRSRSQATASCCGQKPRW